MLNQKGNLLPIVGILILLVLGVGGYFFGVTRNSAISESVDTSYIANSPESRTSTTPPEESEVPGKTFVSKRGNFSFTHPESITPYEDNTGLIHLQFTEPLPPGTPDGVELAPGYIIDFTAGKLEGKTLKEKTEEEIAKVKQYGFINKELSETKTLGLTGFTYTGGAQVASTHIYLPQGTDSYLEISYAINDKNNRGYEDQVKKIISSLSINLN
jgi:hypothetical protein